ncbi:MAG: ethanolamine ammonia-lyase subunit EutC [Hyphomicrobium sp.]
MSDDSGKGLVIANPWGTLRRFTPARIALGRSGTSLPTAPHLAFQLAHARARNAVHHALDVADLSAKLAQRGHEVVTLQSAAQSRPEYLQRPDLGRRLDDASRATLAARTPPAQPYDIAFVIADGLSALAIEQNAAAFLECLMPAVSATGAVIAPLTVVSQARVAIGDEIGERLGAKIVVVLIGERPGLSSPDSMGLYMTYAPRAGLTDEARNCISNVRPEGLSFERAAHKLVYLLGEAAKRGLSGVDLKDEAGDLQLSSTPPRTNFLAARGEP